MYVFLPPDSSEMSLPIGKQDLSEIPKRVLRNEKYTSFCKNSMKHKIHGFVTKITQFGAFLDQWNFQLLVRRVDGHS